MIKYEQKKTRLESIQKALEDRKDRSPITRRPESLFPFFLLNRCVLFTTEVIYQKNERSVCVCLCVLLIRVRKMNFYSSALTTCMTDKSTAVP